MVVALKRQQNGSGHALARPPPLPVRSTRSTNEAVIKVMKGVLSKQAIRVLLTFAWPSTHTHSAKTKISPRFFARYAGPNTLPR